MAELQEKYESLIRILKGLESVAVAFSGGVDSTFLLKAASDALGERAAAVTVRSVSFPQREEREAREFCEEHGIRQIFTEVDQMAVPGFAQNPPDRCYICKSALFRKIRETAAENGLQCVVEGSNTDDAGDYRPGMRALAEQKILSPLREALLSKTEIRLLSRQMGLPTWDKPSFACLATRFVYDDAVSLEGKATVIEVYYKKRLGGRSVLHYCKYVGDTVLYATENARVGDGLPDVPLYDAAPGKTRVVEDADPYGAETDGVPVGDGLRTSRPGMTDSEPSGTPAPAERGLYDHGKYPFVLDPLFPVEGSPCGYGFVDLCANGQTAIDLLRTAFVKNALVGATPRYFQRIDGAVNEEEFLDISRPLVHVSGNLGEDSLRQIGYLGLPGAYLNVLESTIRELRETSGNTETATGIVHSGVTAASAIAALQEASGKGSRDATRSAYIAFGEIIELCIELIRQFYTLPRQFRITGALGEDFVSFSNRGLLPRPLPPVGGVDMGLREPVFDVKVSAQKRSAYSRLSQNELALELYKLGLFEQGREQQALSCLNMMEFDGREELMRRLSASLGLAAQLRELQNYRALALALAKRYRPDLALGLLGQEPAPPPAEGEEPTLPHEAPAAENGRIQAAQAVAP